MIRFYDRTAAGRALAKRLEHCANAPNTLVVGLPRGGVPVAYEVAKALNLLLDICLARKLGLPDNKEVAIGAIAPGGIRVFNYELINALDIPKIEIEHLAIAEIRELERRQRVYIGKSRPSAIAGRTVILIDDGLATGATARAAIAALERQHVRRIVVAVPVAPYSVCEKLNKRVSRVVCISTPSPFGSISRWYEHFEQVTDEEVTRLLADLKQPKQTSDNEDRVAS